MSRELQDKVCLVTGASRGLGAAIALSLGKHGAKVAVNYFASPDKAHRVVERIRQAGGQAEAFPADVRAEAEVNALVAGVVKVFGPIDVLVINGTGPQPFIK